MTFQTDQTVYLADGREALYVMHNGGQHLVRVMLEVEGSYDEPGDKYPDDRITAASKVYDSPPVEVYDQQIAERKGQLLDLSRQITAARQEIADAGKAKAAMEKAAAKYPCIQQALDFIEGRITHVVAWPGYGAAKIEPLREALQSVDTWGGKRSYEGMKRYEGMKLLNLFGTDEKGRQVAWGLNMYPDGSGATQKQIWPAQSEAEARQIVVGLLTEAFAAWREGGPQWRAGRLSIPETLKANPWFSPPDDWTADQAKKEREEREAKIAELREKLAALEAARQPAPGAEGGAP